MKKLNTRIRHLLLAVTFTASALYLPVSLFTPISAHAQAAAFADMVITDARVYTANEAQPSAEAVAVRDGKIVFVGSNQDAEDFISEETDIVELGGQMLLPGFIDSHNHVFEGASEAGGNCEVGQDLRLDEQVKHLRKCRSNIKAPGDWVIGYGHQFDALMDGNARTNPRKLLDRIFPDNPVIIMEESSHSMIVNSLALDLAGISKDSSHPQGGRIMFDPRSGEPNGVLFDNAGDIVMELAWNSLPNNFQDSYDGLLAGMEEVVANGITTVGDGRLYWKRGWYQVWQQALRDDEVIVRASLRPWIYPESPPQEQLEFLKTIRNNNINDLLIVNQVKMYSDGILHFGTAKMLEAYKSSWQVNAPYGINYIPPQPMKWWISNLDKIGYGAHVHAIGDGGVRETLDAIELSRTRGSEQLYSMTHLEMVAPEDHQRFKQLAVHADFQAGAEFFDQHSWASPYVGRKKARQLMPMRKIYDTGANITFSSDWTVNSLNPLVAIANSVRLRKTQGLPDVHEAIYAATLNGAKALGLESVTGSIAVDKSADFVVLERDITTLSPAKIEDTAITMTILQGEVVFDSDDTESIAEH